jgi:hypothetical protein
VRRTLVVNAIVTLLITLIVGFAVQAPLLRAQTAQQPSGQAAFDTEILASAMRLLDEGKQTFRFDTFGDEAFWGDQLRLHEAIAGAKFGGVGDGVSPRTALAVGLKVDSQALPASLIDQIKAGKVDLDDPAITLALLKLNAVIGVTGFFDEQGKIKSLGIQCALCHTMVDDSVAPGIGRRLDGWANRDLDSGAIIALAPNLKPINDLLGVDDYTARKVLKSWGPGKFDARLLLDGKAFGPDGHSGATLNQPIFNLSGVNYATSTGGWGNTSYWTALVASLLMQGEGNFFDPRLKDATHWPIAARAGFDNKRVATDRITPRLAALQLYQSVIPPPQPPAGSFDATAARRGEALFAGKANCATCHVPPLFSEPGLNWHTPEEIGIDGFEAERAPVRGYRTAPLRGLWTHQKGGFYHDGRFATLLDVLNHYDGFLKLSLTAAEKNDLIEYLKSL